MFWKSKAPVDDEPFDEASYVPEPTDHFGQSLNNMQKGGIGVSATMFIFWIFRLYWQAHH